MVHVEGRGAVRGARRPRRGCVLVVEAHELSLRTVRAVLELDGDEVVTCTALQLCQAERVPIDAEPALVVVELDDGGPGAAALRRLARDPRTASAPLLVVRDPGVAHHAELPDRPSRFADVDKPVDVRALRASLAVASDA